MVVSFVDFLISGIILLGLIAWHDCVSGWRIITLPLFITVAFADSIGAGLWLASLNVQYWDFRYIVPLLIKIANFSISADGMAEKTANNYT